MRTTDFNFILPPDLIAQHPAVERDKSRLLVLNRSDGRMIHRQFFDFSEYLKEGDVLVLNNSRVIPARLRGVNSRSEGRFEILLLEEAATNDWWVMLRPGKRARPGTRIRLVNRRGIASAIEGVVTGMNKEGHRRVRFEGTGNISGELEQLGEMPLPPYIQRNEEGHSRDDRSRYQTVFADPAGSVAAPTAGLHFTNTLLDAIRERGVAVVFVTLHVGAGTFAPVKAEALENHTMHEERYELGRETVDVIARARDKGGSVVAVGTTTLRVLESVAERNAGRLKRETGRTNMFIYPPHQFRVVDKLLTNFHLPCSTLLMLASAFAAPGKTEGRELMLAAYAEAVRRRYRFFSYGDAMLLV